MWFSLHLVILFASCSCKAEEEQVDFTGLNATTSTHRKNTSDVPNISLKDESSTHVIKTPHQLTKQDSTTRKPTRIQSYATRMAPTTTINGTARQTSNQNQNIHTITSNTKCTSKEDKHKTGIVICIIIIVVLVLMCAVLIICSVALANKVSSLKKKLTQSKRQARSNGDFLSASSMLWPSGMETWQKQPQEANQSMDEIALGDSITFSDNEQHRLMATITQEKSGQAAVMKTTTLPNDETITTISTVEI